jgi:hypothetical protein
MAASFLDSILEECRQGMAQGRTNQMMMMKLTTATTPLSMVMMKLATLLRRPEMKMHHLVQGRIPIV